MTVKRVWINKSCVSCGMSEVNCPEVFKLEVGEGAKVIEGVDYQLFEKKIRDAAESCPVQAIMLDED
jgi:ferredoxin